MDPQMILDYVESQDKCNVEFLDECTPEYDRLGDESIDD